MIVLTNAAKPVLLRLKLPYLRGLTLRLYQNDWTPGGLDVAANYVEASFPGYSPQSLSDFGQTYLNPAGQGETDSCVHLWTQTVAEPHTLVYGYFVTDAFGWLIFAERNPDGPVSMNATAKMYRVRIAFLEDTLR